MSKYNFKKFENVRGKTESRITITQSYSFGLPTQFYEQNDIENYDYAVLYYDEENKAVAIQFTNDETEENKFSISHHQKYGGSISARSFFQTYRLDPKEYKGKYEWEKKNLPGIGEVFIIKLEDKEED